MFAVLMALAPYPLTMSPKSVHPTPDSAAEAIWLVLSFLSLPLAKQRAMIESAAGNLDGAEAVPEGSVRNGDLLLMAIDVHSGGWIDEFEPCPTARQFFDRARAMSYPPVPYADFLLAAGWRELRELAGAVLAEAGLPKWPVEQGFDVEDFVEPPDASDRLLWPA